MSWMWASFAVDVVELYDHYAVDVGELCRGCGRALPWMWASYMIYYAVDVGELCRGFGCTRGVYRGFRFTRSPPFISVGQTHTHTHTHTLLPSFL
jgi:hypothetical protein